MNDQTSKPEIIKGLNDLVDYLKSIGLSLTKPTLRKYIDAGLPHWKFNNIYHFYTQNVDLFFKNLCSSQGQNSDK